MADLVGTETDSVGTETGLEGTTHLEGITGGLAGTTTVSTDPVGRKAGLARVRMQDREVGSRCGDDA